jgi:YVTN family beta-propeller protein
MRSGSVLVVVVLGVAAALVVPGGVTAMPARSRCRPTAFVTNAGSETVSTIDAKTRTEHPIDITVGSMPFGVAVTPDGKTAFVANTGSDTVSTIDVKTRTKNPADILVGRLPSAVAITPHGKAAFVTNFINGTASDISRMLVKKAAGQGHRRGEVAGGG